MCFLKGDYSALCLKNDGIRKTSSAAAIRAVTAADQLIPRPMRLSRNTAEIDNARQSLNRAKADLNRFSKELTDVRDLQGLNIEIGDFLTFADFFFDGFLADILVQSKIRQAQDKIDDAIIRVEEVLRQLRNYR